MKTLFLLVVSIVVCQAYVYAQVAEQPDPIDKEYRACLSNDTSVTNLCNCAFKAYGKYNDQMDLYYKRLIKEIPDTARKYAEKAQGAWMTWRDTEFGTYNCIFDKEGSQWNRVRTEGRLSMIKERAHQLKAYYEVLHDSRKEKR